MAELTPKDINDFIAKVKESDEYKNPDCKAAIDDEAVELLAMVNIGALENEPGMNAINAILDNIAKAIRKAQEVEQPMTTGAFFAQVDLDAFSPKDQEVIFQTLLQVLNFRFHEHMERHVGIQWNDVEAKLKTNPKKLRSLFEMEKSEGEPDVGGYDEKTGEYLFFDCSAESPAGRRNCVYDKAAEDQLKIDVQTDIWAGNAVDMAKGMGIELLDRKQYEYLQTLGEFDRNSWSWLKTPEAKIKNRFAFNGDRNNGSVIINKGEAYSHDDDGGFRGVLRV